jgi:nitrate/nitrite-specific signal transduction histidine kinase
MNTRDALQSETRSEPLCLVPPTAKWYRPGQGFTCRQIMLPLVGIGAILIALAGLVLSGFSTTQRSPGWLEVALLMIGLALLARAIYFMRRSLLGPLTEVRQWVSRIRGDDLSARIPDLPGGEFSELASDINDLALSFQVLSNAMESEVQAQAERLAADAERLNFMEERTHLAHELHDSLAQTIASLRIRVRVLDEKLHQGDESLIWDEMEKIEAGVDEANSELRELIARFRAPMLPEDCATAIERLAARFRKNQGIDVFLQNGWGDDVLAPEQQIEVVRIVQEALANIRKHGAAHTVRILLRRKNELYRMLIEDDGVGFEESSEPASTGEHIGLAVMQERAERLGGELRVESEPGEGTRVLLNFSPGDDIAAEHQTLQRVNA